MKEVQRIEVLIEENKWPKRDHGEYSYYWTNEYFYIGPHTITEEAYFFNEIKANEDDDNKFTLSMSLPEIIEYYVMYKSVN